MTGVPPDVAIPTIDPVADAIERPRWSVMIPTYNCSHLAAATIESVLAQDPGSPEMEIVVVDDASTDDIEGVVQSFGDRVRLHRQPCNLGVPTNLTEAIRLARGEIVHLLHGDDQVRAGFYAAMDQAFSDPDVGAAWCRQIFMDHEGQWTAISPIEAPEGVIEDVACFLARQQRIMTPSICVRRRVYETVGGFHPALRCVEDWEMWVRIAARFAVYHVREPLAVYRMHDASNTGRNLRNAEEVAYARMAIELFRHSLPPHRAREVMRAAQEATALHAAKTGYRLLRGGDRRAALAQARAALRLGRSPETIARTLVLVAGALTGGIRS
jgi:glycosyltransferase involved in cell wall biosynthesis